MDNTNQNNQSRTPAQVDPTAEIVQRTSALDINRTNQAIPSTNPPLNNYPNYSTLIYQNLAPQAQIQTQPQYSNNPKAVVYPQFGINTSLFSTFDPRVLIYAFFIPLELKINKETYYAVKIGKMDPRLPGFGSRFSTLKTAWKPELQLPNPKNVVDFYNTSTAGDDWSECLAHLNLAVNQNLIFLQPALPDSEHTIRAGLLARFGGFSLPSKVIEGMLGAVQSSLVPDLSNTGHTEFIALRMADITKIKNVFIAENLSMVHHDVMLLYKGKEILVSGTAVLYFNDYEDEI